MKQLYQVLLKLWYVNGYITFAVISVNAEDIQTAENEADELLQANDWDAVKEYQVVEVSKSAFKIRKWNVRLNVFKSGRPEKPQIQYIRVGAPDAVIAAETACEIVRERNGIINVKPVETLIYDSRL
jgi:hypothetical protein